MDFSTSNCLSIIKSLIGKAWENISLFLLFTYFIDFLILKEVTKRKRKKIKN